MIPAGEGRRFGGESVAEEIPGLIVAAAPLQAIPLGAGVAALHEGLLHPHLHQDIYRQVDQDMLQHSADDFADAAVEPYEKRNWLARPISGRTLSWVVDGLVVTSGVLLFTLIFLSIAHELPPWPLAVGTGFAAAGFVATAYWGVFCLFGGASLGVRLARAARVEEEEEGLDALRIR
jgi:hypothetical protein